MKLHLDLELAGTLDLREVGADVWSRHEDTVPILCGFAVDDEPAEAFDFIQGSAKLECRLFDALREGAEIHAWNASFEATIWNNLLVLRHHYPPLSIGRFHCTMATAANAGLPMKLEDAALACGSPFVKDKVGAALMKRMARPRGYGPGMTPRWWHVESPERLDRLRVYNITDVETERAISRRIPCMSARERQIWLCDQAMNARGMPVDYDLVNTLDSITSQELSRLDKEIYALTGGTVGSAAQGTRLLEWLQSQGYPHDTLAKDTLAKFVNSFTIASLPAAAQAVLHLRAEAAKSSTAKLKAMMHYAQHDNRARGLVQYGGAVRTLRWAGRGPQIQNYPRPVIKNVDLAIAQIRQGMDADGLRQTFGRPLDVVSSCLRGCFRAPRGYRFVVCDYHAVEAIALAWLAGDGPLLDVFRRGEDVYIYTAQGVGSNNRTLGKVLRLACGYGMGAAKFRTTAEGYGLHLTLDEAERHVAAFRAANSKIVNRWGSYENAAFQVIYNPGIGTVKVGQVGFRMAVPNRRLAGSLLIEKPSGGLLVYRNARIEEGGVVYDGVNQYTRKWEAIRTYGGKLVENVTQAIARDLLADAMVAFERDHAAAVATVHDELVAVTAEHAAPAVLADMQHAMRTSSPWATGMPLSTAGYIATRYAKA